MSRVLRWLTGLGGRSGGGPWDLPPRGPGERYLILVRHGHAAAGWGDDPDPGLDDVGRAEAEAMAASLEPAGPLPIVVSPLRRARETAAPLERRWHVEARVERAVGEIVSPTDDLAERSAWLRAAMAGRWSDLGAMHHEWRQGVLDALRSIDTDTVVVTHFVAINVAVGAATADERVTCCTPGNASQTVLRVRGDELTVMALGQQAITEVR